MVRSHRLHLLVATATAATATSTSAADAIAIIVVSPPLPPTTEGGASSAAHSVVFQACLSNMSITEFDEAKRSEFKRDLATSLLVPESQVVISAVRAGSVIVDTVVSGLSSKAAAHALGDSIKAKASSGVLVSEARYGPVAVKALKTRDAAAQKARENTVGVDVSVDTSAVNPATNKKGRRVPPPTPPARPRGRPTKRAPPPPIPAAPNGTSNATSMGMRSPNAPRNALDVDETDSGSKESASAPSPTPAVVKRGSYVVDNRGRLNSNIFEMAEGAGLGALTKNARPTLVPASTPKQPTRSPSPRRAPPPTTPASSTALVVSNNDAKQSAKDEPVSSLRELFPGPNGTARAASSRPKASRADVIAFEAQTETAKAELKRQQEVAAAKLTKEEAERIEAAWSEETTLVDPPLYYVVALVYLTDTNVHAFDKRSFIKTAASNLKINDRRVTIPYTQYMADDVEDPQLTAAKESGHGAGASSRRYSRKAATPSFSASPRKRSSRRASVVVALDTGTAPSPTALPIMVNLRIDGFKNEEEAAKIAKVRWCNTGAYIKT